MYIYRDVYTDVYLIRKRCNPCVKEQGLSSALFRCNPNSELFIRLPLLFHMWNAETVCWRFGIVRDVAATCAGTWCW